MQKKKTILIVDDIEINRAILAEIFKEDYEIIEAVDGGNAIQVLENEPEISAVLLDVLMPKVNGLDVLREMNRTGKIESIPVFLITAAESVEL